MGRKTPGDASAQAGAAVLAAAIREQRKLLGLTQEALAQHAAVGLAFLYDLERGKPTLRLDKVLAVLRALGIRVTLSLARPDAPGGTVTSELPERER